MSWLTSQAQAGPGPFERWGNSSGPGRHPVSFRRIVMCDRLQSAHDPFCDVPDRFPMVPFMLSPPHAHNVGARDDNDYGTGGQERCTSREGNGER